MRQETTKRYDVRKCPWSQKKETEEISFNEKRNPPDSSVKEKKQQQQIPQKLNS